MVFNSPIRIVFLGAGNLASKLSVELKKAGHSVIQVYSRTLKSAGSLAKSLDTEFTNDISQIDPTANIYFVVVNDHVIEDLLSKYNFSGKLVVHTSGSISMDVLKNYTNNFGVFYPLQTFMKSSETEFSQIPLFIEANNPDNERLLLALGKLICEDVNILSSEKRKILHLAAVFACNFTNHMYNIADEILKNENLSFEWLKPLIFETSKRISDSRPGEIQTGPAVRNELNVIKSHLELLKNSPGIQEIYELLSKSIYETKQKEK